MTWPNTDRAGHAHDGMAQRPFWWIGPDGKSKVLFLQPGGYGNSGSMGKGGSTGRPWFGQRDPDKIPAVIKTGTASLNPNLTPLVALDNEHVCPTILKPIADGSATLLRLRSLSDRPETVKVSFPASRPKSVHVCSVSELPGAPIAETVSLLPYGLLTLRIESR